MVAELENTDLTEDQTAVDEEKRVAEMKAKTGDIIVE